jgi:reductive dehalogenase
MESVLSPLLVGMGLLWAVGFGVFGYVSFREGERRAAKVAFGLAGAGLLIFIPFSLAPVGLKLAVSSIIGIVLICLLILASLPIGRIEFGNDTPRDRRDERDIMFARARLVPGSPEYESYYAMRPENRGSDDLTRTKPGLLSPKARFANPYHFAASQASFGLTEALREAVDGPVSEERPSIPAEKLTSFLKGATKYYGALEVGITELQPYHVYSHTGRGTGKYGATIPIRHSYAIAFSVEMNFFMIAANPAAPGVMESARQYVESARIAVQLANLIRQLGFSARAHIDGNYQVIAPLVARDAGLGEIGRMGLLMTPSHGPRVRLGVVTTDAPLRSDPRHRQKAVIDFCTLCKKCADNCPSRSIPFETRKEIDGLLRWQLDAETCFRYWCTVGTDCGICMTVCPYSHPATLSHNLIRWAIGRSGFARRTAYWMDDMFYGKRPKSRPAPSWTKIND